MIESRSSWRNTTHDWASTVDAEHLAEIRRQPDLFAPGDVSHLILEVLAYAADEATSTGSGHCRVILHGDGSVSVADNGRGTDTRYDEDGEPVKKPIMASKDLRFFDNPDAELLPDGHPRRGMSVVAALSGWLIHTNQRRDGAWTQRYEHGIPVTDLQVIPEEDRSGTTVRFLADFAAGAIGSVSTSKLVAAASVAWPHLTVEVSDQRAAGVLD